MRGVEVLLSSFESCLLGGCTRNRLLQHVSVGEEGGPLLEARLLVDLFGDPGSVAIAIA